MKYVIFEHPVINTTISNKEPHVQIFKGHNLSSGPIRVSNFKKNCSCTSIEHPDIILPGPFEIKMIVDKTGLTGFFSSNATVTFSNEESVKLTLTGKITD